MTAACEHLADPDWDNITGPVLVAGDVGDLPLIQDICRRLPWDAEGSIVIEAAASIQMRHLDVPAGVGVRWLVRGEGTRARTRGERIAGAVYAWCVEWTCGEPPQQWTLWLSPRTPAHVARMARSLLGVSAPPA
ncbi:MAG: SIP domain-containing protein [Actinomycetota bacterium]